MNNCEHKKMPKHNKGVVCDVHNCIYNGCENCCTAEQIAIGPSYAKTGTETLCATFCPKNDCDKGSVNG